MTAITAKVNGVNFEGFTTFKLVDNAQNLCNNFTLDCVADPGEKFPIPSGADIDISLLGFNILPGKVEEIDIDAPVDGYSVKVSGRSKLKAFLKEDLPPSFSLKGPISLKRVIEKCLKAVNVYFEVIDDVGDLKDFTEKEILTSDVGGNAWDFITQLIEKRQCIIKGNRKNQIVITRHNKNKYKKVLQRLVNDVDRSNNILNSGGNINDSDRKQVYHVVSQQNVTVKRTEAPPTGSDLYEPDLGVVETESLNAEKEAKIKKLREALANTPPNSEQDRAINELLAALGANVSGNNKSVKSNRFQTNGITVDPYATDGGCWETAENPSDDDECKNISARRCNNARVESISYRCTVVDDLADDEPWESGWLIDVVDEYCDINATMSIKIVSREQTIDKESGEVKDDIKLSLSIPDSYGDETEISAQGKQVTVMGENFQQGGLS